MRAIGRSTPKMELSSFLTDIIFLIDFRHIKNEILPMLLSGIQSPVLQIQVSLRFSNLQNELQGRSAVRAGAISAWSSA